MFFRGNRGERNTFFVTKRLHDLLERSQGMASEIMSLIAGATIYRLDGHEFEQAPGVSDGQGGLACCTPWDCKESDTTEQLN